MRTLILGAARAEMEKIREMSENLPKMRNEYAHGSTDRTLRSLRLVSEIIIQLYQSPAS